jgi:tetratricopeptide (TPR) repeat protein
MYCADCGARNSEGSTYCAECGIRLGAADDGQTAVLSIAPEPRSLQAVIARAYDLREQGELEAAIEMCRRAIALEPRSRAAHSLLGLLYEDKGQPAFAIREYKVVLEIDPRSTAEREKLDILLAQQREDEAAALRPMVMREFWRRWRIAMVTGAAGAAVLLVAIGVQVARVSHRPVPPEQLVAPGITSANPAFRPGGPGVRGAVPANQPLYPVKAAGELFAPPQEWKTTPPPNPRIGPLFPPSGSLGGPGAVPVPPITASDTGTGPAPTGPPPPPVGPVPSGGMFAALPDAVEPATPKTGSMVIRMVKPAAERAPMITPVNDTAPVPEISGDARAGQERQLAALRKQREGQYQEAVSLYQSAIEAYERELAGGGGSRSTQQAIETCKRGIESCRSKLSGS